MRARPGESDPLRPITPKVSTLGEQAEPGSVGKGKSPAPRGEGTVIVPGHTGTLKRAAVGSGQGLRTGKVSPFGQDLGRGGGRAAVNPDWLVRVSGRGGASTAGCSPFWRPASAVRLRFGPKTALSGPNAPSRPGCPAALPGPPRELPLSTAPCDPAPRGRGPGLFWGPQSGFRVIFAPLICRFWACYCRFWRVLAINNKRNPW